MKIKIKIRKLNKMYNKINIRCKNKSKQRKKRLNNNHSNIAVRMKNKVG
jgi:hypothetical protein